MLLSACATSDAPDSGSRSTQTSAPVPPPTLPTPPTFQVLDNDCPTGWSGLQVTTQNAAEVEYLDDMPACVSPDGARTYLANRNEAVWLLSSVSGSAGLTASPKITWGEQSFIWAVRDAYPGKAIIVPGAEMTIDLPPQEVEWVIDLPLSFGWQGHDVVVDKIESAGQAAALAALKRQTQAGAVLAVCTMAVTQYAESVRGLQDASASEVMLSGLGVSASTSRCLSDSAAVGVVDDAGQPVSLADELRRLQTQAELLGEVQTKVGYAQRASGVLALGLKLLPRG